MEKRKFNFDQVEILYPHVFLFDKEYFYVSGIAPKYKNKGVVVAYNYKNKNYVVYRNELMMRAGRKYAYHWDFIDVQYLLYYRDEHTGEMIFPKFYNKLKIEINELEEKLKRLEGNPNARGKIKEIEERLEDIEQKLGYVIPLIDWKGNPSEFLEKLGTNEIFNQFMARNIYLGRANFEKKISFFYGNVKKENLFVMLNSEAKFKEILNILDKIGSFLNPSWGMEKVELPYHADFGDQATIFYNYIFNINELNLIDFNSSKNYPVLKTDISSKLSGSGYLTRDELDRYWSKKIKGYDTWTSRDDKNNNFFSVYESKNFKNINKKFKKMGKGYYYDKKI